MATYAAVAFMATHTQLHFNHDAGPEFHMPTKGQAAAFHGNTAAFHGNTVAFQGNTDAFHGNARSHQLHFMVIGSHSAAFHAYGNSGTHSCILSTL